MFGRRVRRPVDWLVVWETLARADAAATSEVAVSPRCNSCRVASARLAAEMEPRRALPVVVMASYSNVGMGYS
jgi:hypothetical protein